MQCRALRALWRRPHEGQAGITPALAGMVLALVFLVPIISSPSDSRLRRAAR